MPPNRRKNKKAESSSYSPKSTSPVPDQVIIDDVDVDMNVDVDMDVTHNADNLVASSISTTILNNVRG
jgi:hypothetical protein